MEFTFAEEMLNVMLENGMIDEEIKQWCNNYIEEQKEKKEPVKEVKKRAGRKKINEKPADEGVADDKPAEPKEVKKRGGRKKKEEVAEVKPDEGDAEEKPAEPKEVKKRGGRKKKEEVADVKPDEGVAEEKPAEPKEVKKRGGRKKKEEVVEVNPDADDKPNEPKEVKKRGGRKKKEEVEEKPTEPKEVKKRGGKKKAEVEEKKEKEVTKELSEEIEDPKVIVDDKVEVLEGDDEYLETREVEFQSHPGKKYLIDNENNLYSMEEGNECVGKYDVEKKKVILH